MRRDPNCPHCHDPETNTSTGTICITRPIPAIVPASIWYVLDLAMLYRRGVPPVAGGSLDQMHWFNIAAQLVWEAERSFRAESAGGLGDIFKQLAR